jgi:uncharacterized protein YndB with AHSA1/START domain
MGNTVRMHAVLKAPPSLVYKAFTTADALAKWLPPDGFTCAVHHFDVRVGGSFRMAFTHLASGESHAFGGTYLDMKPDALLRYSDKFDDPNLPGEMIVTVTLTPVSCGTDVQVMQENIPDIIPLEQCYLGWQDSMRQLAALVEGAARAPG